MFSFRSEDCNANGPSLPLGAGSFFCHGFGSKMRRWSVRERNPARSLSTCRAVWRLGINEWSQALIDMKASEQKFLDSLSEGALKEQWRKAYARCGSIRL
jgi:hypothetical protein